LKYRAEIDGLRALAVVPVILFHAGFELFSGGFVGVDVFFVISGYLITTILIEDIENQRFSLVNFYQRRARRILPALFFVMFVCIPFAWIWMLPSQMKDFSQSLVAVSLFASNVLFWRESGYFDAAAEEKPLLHTWSLAVEEQYYMLFPIFLCLAWRYGKNRVFWMIVVMASISLLFSEWGWRNKATANFYLAPTRAWELFAGSIAAFIVQKNGVQKNNFLALLGLAAIIFSIFAYDESTPFPSVYALVPVLGVVLLVLYAHKETLAAKFLSTKALVGIGLISYSAYLWHQPLLAFARVRLQQELSFVLMVFLSLASLVLAFLSWKYIEKPFRDRAKISRKAVFVISIFGICLFFFIGQVAIYKEGFRDRYNDVLTHLEWMSLRERADMVGYPCSSFNDPQYPNLVLCEYGDVTSETILVAYGDSHHDAISYTLDRLAKERGVRVIKANIGSCGVIFDITALPATANLARHHSSCSDGFEQLRQMILSYDANVLVVSRWTFQMFPAPRVVDELNFNNGVGGQEVNLDYRENRAVFADGSSSLNWEFKREAFVKLLNGLASASNSLFVNYPIPEMGWNIFNENLKSIRETGALVDELMYPSPNYYKRNEAVIGVLDRFASENPNVHLVRADLAFCDSLRQGFCVGQIGNVIYYSDDDHLSDAGAMLFLNQTSLNDLFDTNE